MKKLLIVSAIATVATLAQAGESGFQASLTPDIAIQPKTERINGVTLNIWGENPQSAFALGFVNGSTGDSKGLSWGFFVNYSDTYTGVDLAFVNWSKVKFTGVQFGAVNVTKEYHGLQLGLLNYAEELRGVQLGFINVASNNPWFDAFPDKLAKGFPFLNWSF